MKNIIKYVSKKHITIVAFTFVFGLFLGWVIFHNSTVQTEEPYEHGTEITSIWTCSMHPQIRSNDPGNCPICGMELIPLETSSDELNPMAISMSATAMQLAQVQTAVVGTSNAEKSIRLNGKVQVDERMLFTQSTHIPGRVEELLVSFKGEFVKQGQVIAFFYSPELVTAQEELFQARSLKDSQPDLYKAAQEKLKNWKLTSSQITQIMKAEKAVEQFPIIANVSGYVTKKMVNLGDYLKQGEAIFEIADLSKVWIMFDVYESDMTWISKGVKVMYTIQSLPGETYEGKISYIDPIINPKTRVANARVEVQNTGLILKPEMFVSGTIAGNVSAKDQVISIPKTAVMWTGKRSVVYVMQASKKGVGFMMREVNLGPDLGDSFVIESGLEVGEEIAVNGTFSIDAAAQLAGKPSMMNPEGGPDIIGHTHDANGPNQISDQPVTNQKTKIANEAVKELLPLFKSYFELKDALANDALQQSISAGKQLQLALEKVDMNKFKGDSHKILMDQFTLLQASLRHFENKKDIDSLRVIFIEISHSAIVLIENFNPLKQPVYVQYCPMANSNKGAEWLSLDEKIKNPYFGKAMLRCGENINSIK